MQKINIQCGEVDYPIGRNIEKNIPVIQDLAKAFNKFCNGSKKYINLYCMGSSGAMMAAIFATIVPKVKIIHIKKDGEKSHISSVVGHPFKYSLNVYIDDFIVSGKTLNDIHSKSHVKDVDVLILGYHTDSVYKEHLLEFKPKIFLYTEK